MVTRTYEDEYNVVHALFAIGKWRYGLVCTQAYLDKRHPLSQRDKAVTCLTCLGKM